MNKDIVEAAKYFSKLIELSSYSSIKKSCNVQFNNFKKD